MADETQSLRCVLVAMALTVAVNVPMLLLRTDTAFIDDWAMAWINHWRGGPAIREIFWQMAHPWFGPLNNLLFWLGGDVPGRLARILSLLFHLANGWLLWQIFKAGRGASLFAATIAVLYLISPFLGAPRATFALYDVSIFFYLLSIWLSGRAGIAAFAGSLVTVLIGLSVETLAALEPIRWWYLYRRGYNVRSAVHRAVPCLAIVFAVAISRLTWEAPYGELYGGHNAIKPFVFWQFSKQVILHLLYYVRALEPLRYVPALFTHDNLLIVGFIMLAAMLAGYWHFRTADGMSRREQAALLSIGLMVLGLGMLPYVLVQKNPPAWTGFYAYLAVASQFGVLILAALAISMLPKPVLRGAALALAIFIFSAMELQFGKWAMYDGQVMADFRDQLATEFRTHPSELLFVRFRPASSEILFVKTCLNNYDINVALDIRDLRNGSFAYDEDCGAPYFARDGKCGVTEYERVPCPPKSTAEFRIHPGMEDFSRFRLFDLASKTMYGPDLDVGTLVVDAAEAKAPQ